MATEHDALRDYLDKLRIIRGSSIASDERSYYPALDLLFNTLGANLTPRVVAIHEIAGQGGDHPDYALQVETTRDLRAVVEAKPASVKLDDLIASAQVRRYIDHFGVCLVTNLRAFALVRLRDGEPRVIMRYGIEPIETTFWRTPVETLVARHGVALDDFITNVLLWDAPITRPKDLAEALARYAREARRRLEHRSDESLAPLREALAEALGLHFTDEQGEHFFRSSLVQTLFYGLFSAWVLWHRAHPSAPPERFSWHEAGDYLSLPVMRELFDHIATGSTLEMLDVRKPLEWAEATLRRTVWGNFAAAFESGDAVNYFYEPFLEAYDPDLREQLGVWYTPREIIAYQVARVDRLLRDELHIPTGLADERVVVLDPATGTGGYLLEVLRTIDRTLGEQGAGALRAMKLRQAATTRVFGFEILPAPFVVAHLQIASLLAGRGAALGERAGVYLTNSLTGWKTQQYEQKTLAGWPALRKEMEAAAHVKHEAKILVILGNPPYYAFAGVAEDEEHDLLAPYYVGLAKRFDVQVRGINDLYIRFFRLAERQIAETTGHGIVSFISNSSWLAGLSHPIMREHMISQFDRIWIDNLNGGGRFKGSRGPDGKPDRSIFEYVGGQGSMGITVATAVTTAVRVGTGPVREVLYRDLWGQGQEKRDQLAWDAQEVGFDATYESLHPSENNRFLLLPGLADSAYHSWSLITDLFPVFYPGFKTSRDTDLISIDREPLEERMRAYFNPVTHNEKLAEIAPVLMQDASRYDAHATRRELLATSRFRDDHMVRVAYRPLDERWLYWEGTTKLLDERRREHFEQVWPGNLYLVANASSRRNGAHALVTDKFTCLDLMDRNALCFPLRVRTAIVGSTMEQPNVAPDVLAHLTHEWHIEHSALADALFFHALAIIRSPAYYDENKPFIMQDWPRIPIPTTRGRLEQSAALGRQVADLLLPDVPFTPPAALRDIAIPKRLDGGQLADADLRVTVRYSGVGRYEPPISDGPGARPGRLWWNDNAYWDNLPADVWAFTIGGYPVVKKWLDYRHESKLKRPLKLAEVEYVAEMARRIAALLALGPVLDANYAAVKAATLDVRAPVAVTALPLAPQGEGAGG